MAEDRQDLLLHYRKSREQLLAAIAGLTDEQMSEPSIDGWSVKDHLYHLALWDDLRAGEVERISAGHDSALKMSEEQDDGQNAAGYEMRRTMSAAQARWELETSRRRLLAAISSATERGLEPSHYGAAALRSGHEGQHVEWLQRWRNDLGS